MPQRLAIEDEVRQLAWALVDQYITDEQASRLEQLLTDEAAARRTYVECMQMNTNLHLLLDQGLAERLNNAARRAVSSSSPIAPLPDLGLTNGETPLTGSEPVA